MSGENTGSIGKARRGDILAKFKDVTPGPGQYFNPNLNPR